MNLVNKAFKAFTLNRLVFTGLNDSDNYNAIHDVARTLGRSPVTLQLPGRWETDI